VVWIWPRGDTGGDVPAADPAASSRPLFFPPAAFVVFDGRQLHPPGARCLHAHSLGGCNGGFLRRRTWIQALLNGSSRAPVAIPG
jgi:hypothetical protein